MQVPVMARRYPNKDKGFLNDKNSKYTSWTVDEKGHANIHRTWYYYDSLKEKIYVMTGRQSKKLENLAKNELISFCIDDPNSPYKGVRGKGGVSKHEDVNFQMNIAQKIAVRYLGTMDNPISREFVERTNEGQGIVLEISPKYYSTWDHGKQKTIPC
jgi:uncharacterized pyridoxamine 5'-phosphate oxidase family protein